MVKAPRFAVIIRARPGSDMLTQKIQDAELAVADRDFRNPQENRHVLHRHALDDSKLQQDLIGKRQALDQPFDLWHQLAFCAANVRRAVQLIGGDWYASNVPPPFALGTNRPFFRVNVSSMAMRQAVERDVLQPRRKRQRRVRYVLREAPDGFCPDVLDYVFNVNSRLQPLIEPRRYQPAHAFRLTFEQRTQRIVVMLPCAVQQRIHVVNEGGHRAAFLRLYKRLLPKLPGCFIKNSEFSKTVLLDDERTNFAPLANRKPMGAFRVGVIDRQAAIVERVSQPARQPSLPVKTLRSRRHAFEAELRQGRSQAELGNEM